MTAPALSDDNIAMIHKANAKEKSYSSSSPSELKSSSIFLAKSAIETKIKNAVERSNK